MTSDDLQVEVARIRREVHALWKQVEWLRQRIAVLLPERHYCPFCKALVSEHSIACASCGRSWGVPEDPKKGVPR